MAEFKFDNFLSAGGLTGAAGMVGGVMDLVGTGKRMRGFKTDLSKAESSQEDFFNREKAGEFDAVLSQARRDLMESQKRKTDTSPLLQAQSTSLGAASSDPRALAGMLGAINDSTNAAIQRQTEADRNRSIAAQTDYATASDQILNQNRMFDRQLGMMGLAEAKQAEQTARENIMNEKNARRSAISDIIGGAIGTAVGVGGGLSPDFKIPDVLTSIARNGGIAKNGGVVQKTPGKFSHESNPIDMVAENGEKVGEVTGGEYIINPKQSQALETAYKGIKESGEPTTKSLVELYKIVDEIFSQPQFA